TRSRPRGDTYTPIKRIPVYHCAHFANLMAGVPTGHTRAPNVERAKESQLILSRDTTTRGLLDRSDEFLVGNNRWSPHARA
ncbi:hypothetical protein WH47_07811, partial [Habropoda laboriosa]